MFHFSRFFPVLLCFLFCIAGIFFVPLFAQMSGGLRISEIMYDAPDSDTGREYIEIVNTGPDDVDVLSVDFYEHGRRHTISAYRGGAVLAPGDIAVIADNPAAFLAQYPSFDGILFDSSFSLNNTGSTIIFSHGQYMHRVTYINRDGADGGGDALHVSRNDTVFAFPPSPGIAEHIPVTTGGASGDGVRESVDALSGDSQTISTQQFPVDDGFRLVTNPDIIFSASVTQFSFFDAHNESERNTDNPLYGAWNFGDGTLLFGGIVEHAYIYPGTYVISFQEYAGGIPTDRHVVQREVTVLFPDVKITRIDDVFVRFTNNHPFVLDISGWRVVSGRVVFTFPAGSFISAKSSLTISLPAPDSAIRSGDNDRILYITAGGGQFDGTGHAKSDDTFMSDQSHAISANTPYGSATASAPEDSISDTLSADFSDSASTYRKQLLVWFAILSGVVILALTPLFLTRADQKKNMRRRVTRKKKK